jgi:hypothetical protein
MSMIRPWGQTPWMNLIPAWRKMPTFTHYLPTITHFLLAISSMGSDPMDEFDDKSTGKLTI